MGRTKSFSVALAVIASLASIYFYWSGPGPHEAAVAPAPVGRQSGAAPEPAAVGAAYDDSGSSGREGRGDLQAQYRASAGSVPAGEVRAFIEKGLQGNYDIKAKLKLAEALYDNNYLPKARDLFNSIGDDEMCRYLAASQPGAVCEGDLRPALAEALYRDGHLKLTRDILSKLVAESVQNMSRVEIGAFQTLRMAYRTLGDLVQYDALVDGLPENYPLKPELLKDAAFYYLEAGNRDKANSILVAATSHYPGNPALKGFLSALTAEE